MDFLGRIMDGFAVRVKQIVNCITSRRINIIGFSIVLSFIINLILQRIGLNTFGWQSLNWVYCIAITLFIYKKQ